MDKLFDKRSETTRVNERLKRVSLRVKGYAGGPAVTVFAGAAIAGVTAGVDGPKWMLILAILVGAGGGLWALIQRAESTEAVAELNRYIAGAVTGGDSFCYLEFKGAVVGTRFDNTNKGDLTVVNQGAYAMYDVFLRIYDLDKRLTLDAEPLTLTDAEKGDIDRSVGNLGVGQYVVLGNHVIEHAEGLRWNISISARNGLFWERLRLRRVDGRWLSAMDVVRKGGPERDVLLMERIDKGYPRDDQGNVAW